MLRANEGVQQAAAVEDQGGRITAVAPASARLDKVRRDVDDRARGEKREYSRRGGGSDVPLRNLPEGLCRGGWALL
jgi:hypothetical protein